MRNCMTWVRSASYSCSHCFFRSASLGLGEPFGTGVFFLAAMHFLNSGESGTDAVAPGAWAAWPLAAAVSQWLYSSLVMTSSPTVATPLLGTPPPQLATTRARMRSADAARAARRPRERDAIRVESRVMVQSCLGQRHQARLSAASGSLRPPRTTETPASAGAREA